MKIATAEKMVVIDASVAAKWYLPEPDRPQARALLTRGEALIAPDLIVAEVLNVIWRNVRTGAVPGHQLPNILESLLASFLHLHELPPLAHGASQIALDLNHPIYDCFYLALAEREGVELVTADERLYRKTQGTRFASIVRKLA